MLRLLPSIGDVYVNAEDWDAIDNKINLKNFTFNFETMQPEPHNPKDRFTYKLPFDYDSNAICPTFDDSLALYSCNDKDWVDAFWEIAGYAMYGEYPFQKMFWFTGSKGRNGKGTCIRVIESLVGDKYTISDIDTRDFREKFYKARLIGKRLASAGDLHNRLANVSSLKQLTGGDRQTTDIKFSDAKSFTSKAKFIFAMNQLPVLPPGENITPIAKRIMILPFDYQIANPDQTVEEKIYREMSGIFNRAIQGLKRLLELRRFTFVKRGEKALERYQNSDVILSDFLDRLIYKEDSNREVLYTTDLFKEYSEYMRENYGNSWELNHDVKIKSNNELYSLVRNYFEDKGIEIKSQTQYKKSTKDERGHPARYYPNVFFKTEEDYEFEINRSISKERIIENEISIQGDSTLKLNEYDEYPFDKDVEF